MMRLQFNAIMVFTVLMAVSCVSKRKLDDEIATSQYLREQNTTLTKQLDLQKKQTGEVSGSVESQKKGIKQLEEDTLSLGKALRATKEQYKQAIDSYDLLRTNNEKMLKNSSTENNKLLADLQKASADLEKKQSDYNTTQQKVTQLNSDLEAREKKLMELEAELQERDENVKKLRASVANALTGFTGKDLSVTVKDGKVYVSLEEQLLFKTGSTTVDPKGVDALKKLAKALENQKDLTVLIEGHTDDVDVLGGTTYKDNWDLSVLRATSIVRILQQNSKLSPEKIVASGRGEYLPIEKAKTAAARAKNRRTEIILTPDLDQLYKIIGK